MDDFTMPQDELAGIKKQWAKILEEHGVFDIEDELLDATASSGGTCPECKGEGGWDTRQYDPEPPTMCLNCGGTGRTGVVEKTIGEIIKEATK